MYVLVQPHTRAQPGTEPQRASGQVAGGNRHHPGYTYPPLALRYRISAAIAYPIRYRGTHDGGAILFSTVGFLKIHVL